MIAAVILAAGESRRMGEPKLLLPFRGRTILECVVGTVLRSPVDRIVVVLGAYEDRTRPVLAGYPVEIAVNPEYPKGMLSSVRRGLRSLPEEARAALIFPGDQPGITGGTIEAVMAAYRATGKGLVLPVRSGRGGHPLLLDMRYRADVEALGPGLGLRTLLSLHPSDVERVEVEDGGAFLDIDTPEDYREACAGTGNSTKKHSI
jgi:molybdenum cofactor cytidylyltransferase